MEDSTSLEYLRVHLDDRFMALQLSSSMLNNLTDGLLQFFEATETFLASEWKEVVGRCLPCPWQLPAIQIRAGGARISLLYPGTPSLLLYSLIVHYNSLL